MDTNFKAGDKVTWSSQAAGKWKTKEGRVIAVVQPNRSATSALLSAYRDVAKSMTELSTIYKGLDNISGGQERNHVSFIVEVPHKGKGKATLYWPRASALRTLEEE